jgi:hypothetical protein
MRRVPWQTANDQPARGRRSRPKLSSRRIRLPEPARQELRDELDGPGPGPAPTDLWESNCQIEVRRVAFAGSVAKDEYIRGVHAELLAPPRMRSVLREEVVVERKIVYQRNVGQGSSGLEGEACSTLAMSSQRRSGTAPR